MKNKNSLPAATPRFVRGFGRFAQGAALWPAIIFLAFLCAASLVFTGMIPSTYEELVFQRFSLHIVLPLFLLVFGLLYILLNKVRVCRLSVRTISFIAFIYALAFGVWWVLAVREIPVDDAGIVIYAAEQFASGDYSSLLPNNYMGFFPYQLGLALYEEGIIRLFGANSAALVLQLLNALYTAVLYYFIVKTSAVLFNNNIKVVFTTLVLLLFCLPPLFYSTFVYGNVPGLLFIFIAVYYTIFILIKKPGGKQKYLCCAAIFVCLVISVNFKITYLIFAAAIVLVLLVQAALAKNIKLAVFALVLVFCAAFAQVPVKAIYTARSGQAIGGGVPKSMNVYVGLTQHARGPGWYDSVLIYTYVDAGYDSDAAAESAGEMVKARLSEMAAHPAQSADFFLRKTLSQWNEPSFAGLWLSHHYGQHQRPLSSFVNSMYTGRLRIVLYATMALNMLCVYFGAFFFLVRRRKTLDIPSLLLSVIFIGGFLFYFVWEAKSQYTLPYYMALIPYAAAGLAELTALAKKNLVPRLPLKRPKTK